MPYPCSPPFPRQARPLIGALALATALALAACRSETPVMTSRFDGFGTLVDISLVRVEPGKAAQAAELIQGDFGFLDQALDPWGTGALARVNQLLPTGEPFVAPPSVLPLVRLSQTYSEQSGGLFNPALGQLTELWGFQAQVPECQPPPREQAIRRLVQANPRIADVRIDGLEMTGRNRALKLDFSSIARGYAIDLAITQLRELGIRDAQVQIGGTLRAIGDRSGQPWRVPIRRASGSGVLGILQLRGDESVATAGAYDRTFVYGGITYHHILDPRTGSPAWDTLAVTVVHRDAASADAAAIALFVAGPKHWYSVAQAMAVPYALLVDSKGTLDTHPEMQARLALIEPATPMTLSPPLRPPPPNQRP